MENQIPGNAQRTTASFKAGQRPADRPVPSGPGPRPTRTVRNNPGPVRNSRPNWPVIIGLGLLSLVTFGVCGFYGVNAIVDNQFGNKIEPGVSISGVYVGEMSRDDAKAKVLKALEGYTQKPVTLSFESQTWTPTLEQLGVTINLDASLNKAYAFNRSGLRLMKLMNPPTTNLPIEIMMDEAKLNGYLTDISDRIRRDGQEPTVKLTPEGKLETTEGKVGFNVDYDATLNSLKKTLGSMTPTTENLLKVHDVPPVITQQEVESFANSIQPYLNGDVTVSYGEKSWTFDQKTIAAQLKLTVNPK